MFYEFSMWYVKCENIEVNSARANARIKLQHPFTDVKMRKRSKAMVIRLPKLSISSDSYFYSLLMCFLPHRKENEILQKGNGTFDSARESFIAKKIQCH